MKLNSTLAEQQHQLHPQLQHQQHQRTSVATAHRTTPYCEASRAENDTTHTPETQPLPPSPPPPVPFAAPTAATAHTLTAMDDVVIRRMFVVPSFEIHGGVSGLFDLGPPGCGLKSNIVALWRQHFVLAEGMLEMECTNLTPENVLETSGGWGWRRCFLGETVTVLSLIHI